MAKDEKELDIHFKKAQLDKKDEKNLIHIKKSIKLQENENKDSAIISTLIVGSESSKNRHEKCLQSDFNYYNDSSLSSERENYNKN